MQSGKQLRLRGKGMPALRGAGAGDLYIELARRDAGEPDRPPARAAGASSRTPGEDNSPETQDFFSRVKGFWEGMKG